MDDEELLKCLCQVVTSLDHFKGLYEYLKQRNMVPGFLAHGQMVLVRKVIVETDLLETSGSVGVTASTMQLPCHSTKTAMIVLQVFLKLHKKDPTGEHMFDWFMDGFFERYPPEKDSMPLKRFLTLHGEEFSKKHPVIFKTICQEISVEVEMSA